MFVAFVIAVLTSSSTIAWAVPCCVEDGDSRADEASGDPVEAGDGCCRRAAPPAPDAADGADEDGEDDEPCSCPLGCAPCCAAAPAPAIVPLAMAEHLHFDAWTLLELTYPDRAPPDGAGEDVLHVPRRRPASVR